MTADKRAINRKYSQPSIYQEVHKAFKVIASLEDVPYRKLTEDMAIEMLKKYNADKIPQIKKVLEELEQFGEL